MSTIQEHQQQQVKKRPIFQDKHIVISKENYKKLEAMAGYRDSMNSVVTRVLAQAEANSKKQQRGAQN